MAFGWNVAIVTNDDVSVHASFTSRQSIAFTLLADAMVEITEVLGITNPQFRKETKCYGVALPGILAINPKGSSPTVTSPVPTATVRRRRPF